MTRRIALSAALAALAAAALVGLYFGVVSWAQGREHAVEILSQDRVFVGLITTGFGTQIGLFTYVRLLRRAIARQSVALAGAGTATSSISMVACCAHHLADVASIVGVSGIAILLVEYRTPIMLLGLATNAVGIAIMLRALRRHAVAYGAAALSNVVLRAVQ